MKSRVSSIWTANLILTIAAFSVFLLVTPGKYAPDEDLEKKATSPTEPTSPFLSAIPLFEDHTLKAGITFSHLQGDEKLTGLNETLGPGACALDYDGDGWMDLFLVNGSGQTRFYGKTYWWQRVKGHALYRNEANGSFTDVSNAAGFQGTSWGMGCTSADLDNDGDMDLLITNIGNNLLYRNNGDGTFTDVTAASGMHGEHWSTSAALADYDGDGLLDIYIVNFIDYKKGARTYETGRQYSTDVDPAFQAELYAAQGNHLYRNLGDLRFSDMTTQAQLTDKGGRGLAATWFDVNADSFPDLFVTNAAGGGANRLFINQGNGQFTDAGIEIGASAARGYQGIGLGDLDNDGDNDLVVGSDSKQAPLLLVNNSRGDKVKLIDRGRTLGLTKKAFTGFSTWSLGIYDFNNDGWRDIFSANGLLLPDPDVVKIPQGQDKRLWLNNGGDTVVEVTQQAGSPLRDRQSARGAVFADFDNDGDTDVYVAHNNDLGQLLINKTKAENPWLGLRLHGNPSNRSAIGAKLKLVTERGTQYRSVGLGSFLSSDDPRVRFGIGKGDRIKQLEITWPSNKKSTFHHLATGQYHDISENESMARPMAARNIPDSADAELSLKNAFADERHRAKYLEWFFEVEKDTERISYLETGFRDSSQRVRLTAVRLIGKKPSAKGLTLLVAALEDPSVEVRIAAIESLQAYEEEISIRWLLRSLYDESPKVRIAVISCFKHFFREEEAVVYRKYLALPHLIQLLNDANAEVVIAAIRALAEAEHFRAMTPLTKILQSNTHHSVRSEAARALGLIREQRAMPALLQAARNDESPMVRSQALIALNRLDYDEFPSLLASLLDDNDTTRLSDGLRIIQAILKNSEDGVTISRDLLIGAISHLLERTRNLSTHVSLENRRRIGLLALEALRLTSNHTASGLILPFLNHSDEKIRARAFRSILALDNDNRTKYVRRGLADGSVFVQSIALSSAHEHGIALDADTLSQHLSHPATRSIALDMLGNHSTGKLLPRLEQILNDEDAKARDRAAALKALAKDKSWTRQRISRFLEHHEPVLREVSLAVLLHQLPDKTSGQETPRFLSTVLQGKDRNLKATLVEALVSRNELWARNMLKKTLHSPNTDTATKETIITRLGQSKSLYAWPTLLQLAKSKTDPLSSKALLALAGHQHANLAAFMWSILRNPSENMERKMIAASWLVPREGRKVVDFLKESQLISQTMLTHKQ